MKLRRFNETGIERAREFIQSQSTDEPQAWTEKLLTDSMLTEAVTPEVQIEPRAYISRHELAADLHGRFTRAGLSSIDRDEGLWTWIALCMFEHICQKDKKGKYKTRSSPRWIADASKYQKLVQHLFAGPLLIYQAHVEAPERAMALLSQPVHTPGKLADDLSRSQSRLVMQALVGAATRMYLDSETSKTRRHVFGNNGSGSPRRLMAVIEQYDKVWDIHGLTEDELIAMLPKEFDRWKKLALKQQHLEFALQ